jgi:ABC-type glycerol-3-phosphate transport system substrate-binding protein
MATRETRDERERTSGASRRPGERGSTSRRGFLAAGATVTATSLVGCLGATSGSGPTATSGEPQPPWTTEALADYVDGDETITIYASTGASEEWHDVVEVINDEFDTSLEPNVFASYGSKVTQRFIQERQADNDQVDVLSSPSGIDERMTITAKEEGREAALDIGREYFEWDLDQNFRFNDVLQDVQQYPFYVTTYNGGPGLALPINEEIFEERGLDVPRTYNDLLDDQYEGLQTTISSSYVAADMVGWIVKHHAEQRGVSEMEWARQLSDHLEFVGASSHTAAAREVRDGNAPMMLYNWPTVLGPFAGEDSPLRAVFPEDVKSDMNGSPVAINKNAPNPWAARFFVSAYLEESVQRRLVTDVVRQIPCRLDLDYSAQNPDVFTEKRLNTEFEPVSFWDSWRTAQVGQEAKDEGVFDL